MAKSIKVTDVLEQANRFFELSPDCARMDRLHVAHFVEGLLLAAKAYAGFGYLVPYGEPGSDSSRVFFYKHRSL